jgi:hypothetical protein
VLDHVDAEELQRDGVDRRRERDDKGCEPEQEERGTPQRPAATRAGTAEVYERREDGEDAKN